MLKRNEYPEIRHEIRRKGWEVLTNPIQQVRILMVQEFYANAWITKNNDQSVNPDPKNWLTMVRGKYLDFSLENVRLAFNLPMMQGDAHPYTRRVNFDQRLDQVLIEICEEGAQWKRDSRGKPVQLRRHDLKPITKKRMEQTRDPSHHGIPEMPQGMHFPPQNYWEQINTSLGELSSNMGQLRMEHQEHSIILHEIREDQRAMREEQQRQERDIEELKSTIGSSRGRRSHHH